MLLWTFNISVSKAYMLERFLSRSRGFETILHVQEVLVHFYIPTSYIETDKNFLYPYLESVSDLPWLPPPPFLSINRLWLVNWRSASGWSNRFPARWLVSGFEPRRDWLNWRPAPLDWLCGAGGRLCVCLGSCNIDIISSLDKDKV